jgi:hypothetical protein
MYGKESVAAAETKIVSDYLKNCQRYCAARCELKCTESTVEFGLSFLAA